MFSVGDKIIYGENGVCTVAKIGPLEMSGASADKLYYYLEPLVGTGVYYTPVDSGAFMRPVISRDEAEALILAIPSIAPAICHDNRFNHVDAFYKELFRQHSCEALVAIVKGLHERMSEKKTKSSRAEITMKRAKDILHGELSIALDMDLGEVESYIADRLKAAAE
ncbi:MAG: CarD family transcriptional regulator [Oscillospiraceae bacterium]|nr:CarD family transcriptional regulator [Oscillospiraceae bacterium]